MCVLSLPPPVSETHGVDHRHVPGLMIKNPPTNAGDAKDARLMPGWGRSPWRRKWQPTPVFLPGESQGQRSLVGYGPWGHKATKVTSHAHVPGQIQELKATSAASHKGFGIPDFIHTHVHTHTCSSHGCPDSTPLGTPPSSGWSPHNPLQASHFP